MTDPLSLDSRVLLRRLVRSLSPWRVAALTVADRTAMRDLEARGLVERHLGIYRLTDAGRAAASGDGPPS